MSKTPYFWTDLQQATERLLDTVVLYDNDPVLVRNLEPADDGDIRCYISMCGTKGSENVRKKLSSPKFHRFRELPNLGWVNRRDRPGQAVFLSRRVVATRQHGLSNNNVLCYSLNNSGGVFTAGNISFYNVYTDAGFVESHKGDFPSLRTILDKIQPNTIMAYGLHYAVIRDADGIRWLYRDMDRVGLFFGADSLLLLASKSFLREEIMADRAFTIGNIREF